MTTEEIAKIRHAHSLLNGLTANENGFLEFIEEATETLQSLLPDDNNWAGHDTPEQILSLVTNA